MRPGCSGHCRRCTGTCRIRERQGHLKTLQTQGKKRSGSNRRYDIHPCRFRSKGCISIAIPYQIKDSRAAAGCPFFLFILCSTRPLIRLPYRIPVPYKQMKEDKTREKLKGCSKKAKSHILCSWCPYQIICFPNIRKDGNVDFPTFSAFLLMYTA